MAQSIANVLVHFIFSTKDRYAFLVNADIRRRMHAYLARVFNEHQSPAIQVGGAADHAHVLCSLGRNHAMSEIMRKAKANSTGWVKTFGGMLSKFGWQDGEGPFSIDPLQVDPVRDYIRNQEEHHRTRTFEEEYLDFLRRYGVRYDERYILKQ